MNRIFLAAATAVLLSLSWSAQAGPYAGFDLNADLLNLNEADSSSYPQTAVGPDLHAGYRFDSLNLAGELGYSTSRGQMYPDNLRLNMLTLDGLYYVPVGGILNLVFTAGAADVNYGDSTATYVIYQKNGINQTARQGNTIFHGDEFDWRAGAGLSFPVTDDFELHFITRYQPLSMGGLADDSFSLSFGMNFYF